jgi:hemerythrin
LYSLLQSEFSNECEEKTRKRHKQLLDDLEEKRSESGSTSSQSVESWLWKTLHAHVARQDDAMIG